MDFMPAILPRVKDAASLTARANEAIAAARAVGMQVIFVVVGFRKGLPEVTDANKSFSAVKHSGMPLSLFEDPTVDASVSVEPGDIIVTKRRVSAFAGSDLEVILRAHRLYHLVLAGISTSGVVLSTLREAADKDYGLTVLSDCCADPEDEVHNVLLSKVFPRQADVMTVQEWTATLK